MSSHPLTCQQFEAQLADYLEPDALDPRQRTRADAHRAHCDACRTLVESLEQLAADAAALPDLTPSRDLWPDVAARLTTGVVPLPTAAAHGTHTAPGTRHPPRTIRVEWFAAAAAALVVATAGVTWQIARATPTDTTRVATADDARRTPPNTSDARDDRTTDRTAPPSSAPTNAPTNERLATASVERGDRLTDDARTRAAGTTTSRALVRTASVGDDVELADPLLTREIDALRTIVRQRYAELDSTTAATIRRNLRIIDQAIDESRRALRRDPKSRFLADQLDRALERKVELLRQAALLDRGT